MGHSGGGSRGNNKKEGAGRKTGSSVTKGSSQCTLYRHAIGRVQAHGWAVGAHPPASSE